MDAPVPHSHLRGATVIFTRARYRVGIGHLAMTPWMKTRSEAIARFRAVDADLRLVGPRDTVNIEDKRTRTLTPLTWPR